MCCRGGISMLVWDSQQLNINIMNMVCEAFIFRMYKPLCFESINESLNKNPKNNMYEAVTNGCIINE